MGADHIMRHLTLNDSSQIPVLGQGTWRMGEQSSFFEKEVLALKTGIQHGLTLIDTAEMYASGKAEEAVGEAIKGFDRSTLFIVSKVLPFHAGKDLIFQSCDKSLALLGTDYLDLYLLHWRGRVPLSETVACMEELKKQGKIRRWGVSNFDTDDMKELLRVPKGENCVINQVLYHLGSRGIEYDLWPFLNEWGIRVMAYCPIAQAGDLHRKLLNHPTVLSIADKHKITPIQLLLAFVLSRKNVSAIPKASKIQHVIQNAQTLDVSLTQEDINCLNKAFPPPQTPTPLDIV